MRITAWSSAVPYVLVFIDTASAGGGKHIQQGCWCDTLGIAMATIWYELENFTTPLPNGLVSPAGDYHNVGMARLAWAAATVGTTPYGPRSHRRAYPLELQWREAMMRASVTPDRRHHWRSNSYDRLDPAEKGAVSFFLGQAQAKLFAHDFFKVSRFVHLDSYLEHYGQPRTGTRPDFIGFRGRHTAIAVEAKGRSLGFESTLVSKAKNQVLSLPNIAGYRPSTTYVHVAWFDRGMWCAYLEDPPQQASSQVVDPAGLTLAYYLPIVYAIRTRQAEFERVRLWNEVPYLRRYFEDVDFSLSVREDVAALVPSEEEVAISPGVRFSSLAGPLYDHALSLDDELEQQKRPIIEEQESDLLFVGPDGVAVELGSSWTEWLAAEE